ncbi:hypothetical protein THAOC_35029 [Thalassiosira oceanica]|uniref:Uncharacterized protein n=1 Tax=Thalassiosira oceanica TaxID=159749 RepID=K0R1I9_THAOC|nr:hypothetical protein THAOC_35029 [Thalassiosira oceanica]|eukprot:EJK46303.1 hypothetical protein THAOC_35029 [Thalassiosira oceanica]
MTIRGGGPLSQGVEGGFFLEGEWRWRLGVGSRPQRQSSQCDGDGSMNLLLSASPPIGRPRRRRRVSVERPTFGQPVHGMHVDWDDDEFHPRRLEFGGLGPLHPLAAPGLLSNPPIVNGSITYRAGRGRKGPWRGRRLEGGAADVRRAERAGKSRATGIIVGAAIACFPYGGTGGSVSDRRRSVFSRNPTGVSLRNYLFFSANASPALAPSERGGRSREEAGDTYLAARGEGADAAGGCGLVALARTIAQWRGRRRLPSKARTSARRAVDAPFAGWSTGSTGRPPDLAKAVEWRDAWGARHGHKAEDRTSRNNQ